jgi:hypothetical protein
MITGDAVKKNRTHVFIFTCLSFLQHSLNSMDFDPAEVAPIFRALSQNNQSFCDGNDSSDEFELDEAASNVRQREAKHEKFYAGFKQVFLKERFG